MRSPCTDPEKKTHTKDGAVQSTSSEASIGDVRKILISDTDWPKWSHPQDVSREMKDGRDEFPIHGHERKQAKKNDTEDRAHISTIPKAKVFIPETLK